MRKSTKRSLAILFIMLAFAILLIGNQAPNIINIGNYQLQSSMILNNYVTIGLLIAGVLLLIGV